MYVYFFLSCQLHVENMAAASESVVRPTENGSSKIVTSGKASDDVTARRNDVIENDAAKNRTDSAAAEGEPTITLNSSLDNTEQHSSNSHHNDICSIRINGVDRCIDNVTMATSEEEVRIKPSDSGSCTSSTSGQVQVCPSNSSVCVCVGSNGSTPVI